MSRGVFPSMTALLGLLAVAGYQNRDKLSELLGGGSAATSGAGGTPTGGTGAMPGLGGLLGGLGGGAGGGGMGGLLGNGLSELTERFRQNGHEETAKSWVGTGPNRAVEPSDLEKAIGPDVLADLTEQTGLSREELLARLSRELPDAVDRYTPEGKLPTDADTRV